VNRNAGGEKVCEKIMKLRNGANKIRHTNFIAESNSLWIDANKSFIAHYFF